MMMGSLVWGVLAVMVCLVCPVASGRNTTRVLSVDNGGEKGFWGPEEFCPVNSFADGFWLKVQRCYESGPGCDDMAVTGLALECRHPDGTSAGFIGSRYGRSFHPYGKWQKLKRCSDSPALPAFLTRFSLKVQHQIPGNNKIDNTAINNMRFTCSGLDLQQGRVDTMITRIEGKGLRWHMGEYAGDYGMWSSTCETGSYICGLVTKMDQPASGSDNTGLNDVKFYCCV